MSAWAACRVAAPSEAERVAELAAECAHSGGYMQEHQPRELAPESAPAIG